MASEDDVKWMELAIAEGEKGRITAPPNPWVGCLIIKDGKIIGSGYHEAAGQAHAEAIALHAAGPQAAGAAAYITLEPCCHHGKTPPCVNALIEAKVKKVVIALEDPDPKVNGKGIAALKKAGIEVETGILSDKATQSLEPYLHHRLTGQSFCIAKVAVSIDGRTAAADSSSQWITTTSSNIDNHRLRAESQAILIGSKTALIDHPLLTVREGTIPCKQPLRVILDRKGILDTDSALCNVELAPTLILTSDQCSVDRLEKWKTCGVEVAILPLNKDNQFNPKDILDLLGRRNILQVMVEGGSEVLGSFMKADLINRLIIYMGPRILGDNGYPLFKNFQVASIDEAPTLKLASVKVLGETVRMDYIPQLE